MRRWWGVGTVLAACSMLQACAAPQSGPIQVRDDQFRPYREYTTGRVRTGTYPNLANLELNGRIDRQSGALTTQLNVELAYLSGHKRGYDTARNSHAQSLRFTRLASHGRCRAGSSCVYTEVFTVDIPEMELRQAAPEGYHLKVFARHGPDAQFIIPKVQIAALFAGLDADRVASPKTASQKPN